MLVTVNWTSTGKLNFGRFITMVDSAQPLYWQLGAFEPGGSDYVHTT